MARSLLVVSIVLMLVAGALAFMNRSARVNLGGDVKEAEARLQTAETNAQNAQQAAKDAADKLTAETQRREKVESDLETVQGQLTAARNEVTTLTSDLAAKTTELQNLEQQVAGMATKEPSDDQTTSDIATQLAELQTSLEAAEREKEILAEKLTAAEVAVKDLEEREKARASRIMSKGLEGKVIAYNPAWNFVVLNLGDNQGVVPQAEMLVKRSGTFLGKVQITSVEPNTSIADIVTSSVSRGAQIQPGDSVIYTGQ